MYKKLKLVKYIFFSLILFVPLELIAFDKINGRACYRFSDDETIVEARHVAEAMAIREALEGFPLFNQLISKIDKKSQVNEVIKIASSSLLINPNFNLDEDLARKKICADFSSEVDSVILKQRIQAYINKERRKRSNIETALPENHWGKVLKVKYVNNSLTIVVRCKQIYTDASRCYKSDKDDILYIQVELLDKDGIPEGEIVSSDRCNRKKEINIYKFSIPTNLDFTYDLLNARQKRCFN